MATNPTDSSIAVPDTGTAEIRTQIVTDSNGNAVNQQVTTAEGVVNDTPTVGLITGNTAPLSMTADGRLRVSVVQAVTYMELFPDSQCNRVNPDDFLNLYKIDNSPWSGICLT